jgi:hypothetical protein
MSTQLDTAKSKLFRYVRIMLGDGMIDVELDIDHYEIALEKALGKFRQRSENAVEESYAFLELQEDTNDYILPNEIQSVKEVFR